MEEGERGIEREEKKKTRTDQYNNLYVSKQDLLFKGYDGKIR